MASLSSLDSDLGLKSWDDGNWDPRGVSDTTQVACIDDLTSNQPSSHLPQPLRILTGAGWRQESFFELLCARNSLYIIE